MLTLFNFLRGQKNNFLILNFNSSFKICENKTKFNTVPKQTSIISFVLNKLWVGSWFLMFSILGQAPQKSVFKTDFSK